MPSEMEFVNFKDFVDSLPAADDFATGDKSVLSGATLRKMDKDVQLQKTAENALAGNVAPAFDATKDYAIDDIVSYNGKIYRFSVVHPAGAWNASHVTDNITMSEFSLLSHRNLLSGAIPPITSFNDLPKNTAIQVARDLNDSTDDARHPWGVVFTFGSVQNGTNYGQIFIEASSTNKYNGILYWRVNRSGTWSPWKRGATQDAIDSLSAELGATNETITGIIGGADIDFTDEFSFSAGQIIAEKTNANYGNKASSTNFDCCDYVNISQFTKLKITCIVRPYTATAFTGLVFYDKDKSPIIGYYYTDSDVAADAGYLLEKELNVPLDAVYVRTTIFSDTSVFGTNNIPFACVGSPKSITDLYEKINAIAPVSPTNEKNILYPDFDIISVPNYPRHDATYSHTEDKIYAFNKYGDGVNGELHIYDKDFTLVKDDIRVQFIETYKDSSTSGLQMKNVDANRYNNNLIVGNGKSSYDADNSYLYVFYEWDEWENAQDTITFSNCGNYTKIDVTELGYKSYGWWCGGEESDKVLVNVNLLNDFYLIRLGRGTNQLAKGTYSATTDEYYNGTWEVLKHWTLKEPTTYSQHGGQMLNGKLYIATSYEYVCQVYEVVLNEDGTAELSILDMGDRQLASSSLKYRFIDGMFGIGEYLYGSPLIKNGAYNDAEKVVLKIKV